MDWKTALKNCLKVAGVCIMLIIPFIAGIAAKENAANGFEAFIGWATMAVTLGAAAFIIYKTRKDGRKE